MATDVAKGQTFPDSGDTYKRIDLPLASQFDLPAGHGLAGRFHRHRCRRGSVDLRLPGDVLLWPGPALLVDGVRRRARSGSSQAHGVYNGRPFPTLFYPHASADSPTGPDATRPSRSRFVGQKLQELLNSRQIARQPGSAHETQARQRDEFWRPDAAIVHGSAVHRNDPPPPDGQPLAPTFKMGTTYSHSISELGQFTTWFGLGVHLNDINSQSMAAHRQLGRQPDTVHDGPAVRDGRSDGNHRDHLHRRDQVPDHDPAHPAVSSADQRRRPVGWVDDINGDHVHAAIATSRPRSYKVSGTFLGQPLSGETADPAQFKTDLIGQVVHVIFTTSSALDPGGRSRKRFGKESSTISVRRTPSPR